MKITNATLIESFARYLADQGKQPATIESYGRDAENFCRYLETHRIALTEIEAQILSYYQGYLAVTCHDKPNSIRRSIIGIRQFFRYLEAIKLIASSPFDQLPLPPRIEDLPAALDPQSVANLIRTSLSKNPPPKAERDAAICCLLAFEGLKASELVRLKWSDYFANDVLPTLRIDPASPQRSPRLLMLQAETSLYLNRYSKALREWEHPFWHSEHNKNMMFIGFKGRHHLSPLPHLTRHGLKFMLYELGAKESLPHLSTEHLRHFAINFLLSQGLSSEQVMIHFGLRRLGNIAKYL